MAYRKPSTRRRAFLFFCLVLLLLGGVGAYLFFISSSFYFSSSGAASSSCFFRSSPLCLSAVDGSPSRIRTDEEIAAMAFSRDLLSQPRVLSARPKVAFLFLTRGTLPHQELWELFFSGHKGMFSIYVHASEQMSNIRTPLFKGREIPSQKVEWGEIDMIDAERRLLTHALLDADNEYFVLLSESCVPLWTFTYIYDYLLNTNISFVDCFYDPGPHGAGRYSKGMRPEIQKEDFHKGAQWFAVTRRHALLIISDSLYYNKFKSFCKRGEKFHNCYPDEHYVQTFLHIIDPMGISNWSVTYVDWRNQKWHPRSFERENINAKMWREIQSINQSVHETSAFLKLEMRQPCKWNGIQRPCYLFARKFTKDATSALKEVFKNGTLEIE